MTITRFADLARLVPGSLRYDLWKEGQFGSFTVFLIESPSSSDLGTGRQEAPLLQAVCGLVGHRFAGFQPLGKEELRETLGYIFQTWKVPKDAKAAARPQFALQISCHGSGNGLGVGPDLVEWTELAKMVGLARRDVSLPYIMSLSACGGNAPNLDALGREGLEPLYLFSFGGEVSWDDAALAWAILYHQVRRLQVKDKAKVQAIIDTIHQLGLGPMRYHRWTGITYKTYSGNAK